MPASETLLLGDVELGRLEITGGENWWVLGDFFPGERFADHAAPFEEFGSLHARLDENDLDDEEYGRLCNRAGDVQEEINLLDLAVRKSDGTIQRIRDFHILEGRFQYSWM